MKGLICPDALPGASRGFCNAAKDALGGATLILLKLHGVQLGENYPVAIWEHGQSLLFIQELYPACSQRSKNSNLKACMA